MNDLIGFGPRHFAFDWMHVVDLGTASHAVGNVFYDAVYVKQAGTPRPRALARVLDILREHPACHGNVVGSLDLVNFTNPKSHGQHYPFLAHVKAAEVRGVIPGALQVAIRFDDGSDQSKHSIKMMEGLDQLYRIMHSADVVLTNEEHDEFAAASQVFLLEYTWLSNWAREQNLYRYSVVPKFHYLVHLVDSARACNPRFLWCYRGEDFVGRMSRLAHACLCGTPPFKVGHAMMAKYAVAMHLRLTRH